MRVATKKLALSFMSSEKHYTLSEPATLDAWLRQSKAKLVVLLAEAPWSGGAHIMKESLRAIAEKKHDIHIDSFDGERTPALVNRFGIEQYPTVIFLRDQKLVSKVQGTVSRRKLSTEIERLLAS
jgi:thioredoxin-like negative regulator of GroEL